MRNRKTRKRNILWMRRMLSLGKVVIVKMIMIVRVVLRSIVVMMIMIISILMNRVRLRRVL